jgi:hypothetical protein
MCLVDADGQKRQPGDSARWVERAAAAEVNGRRVNEAIERGTHAAAAVFVCECGNLGCNATMELTITAYENVRSGFDRFLVVPGTSSRISSRSPSGTRITWSSPSRTAERCRSPRRPTAGAPGERIDGRG